MVISNALAHKSINTRQYKSEINRATKYRHRQYQKDIMATNDYPVWVKDNKFNRYCFTDNARFRIKAFDVFRFEIPNIYDIFGKFDVDYKSNDMNYIFILYNHNLKKDPYDMSNYEFDESYKYFNSKSYKTPAVLMYEDKLKYQTPWNVISDKFRNILIDPITYVGIDIDVLSNLYPKVEIFSGDDNDTICYDVDMYPTITARLDQQLDEFSNSLYQELNYIPMLGINK